MVKLLQPGLFALLLGSSVALAALTVVEPRCDWATNPLGVDSATPHLTWKLSSPTRGDLQTAYQVRVASSLAQLETDLADLWDSGRVDSSAQLQVAYHGTPLTTGQQVFWQVRVWDAAGEPSPWSEPASWTMGVVNAADWSARWITDAGLAQQTRQKLGFSTPPVDDANTPQWLVLDLGAEQNIAEIRLHAVVHSVNERLGFPRWFKLELARSADFTDAVTVADHTTDPINLWKRDFRAEVASTPARYLRVSTPQLRLMDELSDGHLTGRLALSQIEVRDTSGANIAVGATVTASASIEDTQWSAAAVVDGLGLTGANARATETLRLRREFAVAPALRRAVIHVTGLGHYRLHLNGTEIAAESLLKPGWTDPTQTVLYDTYDVTAALHADAPNAIGLTLRHTPGGNEIVILPEGTIVSLLPDATQEQGGLIWQKIRTSEALEGWVGKPFLTTDGNE